MATLLLTGRSKETRGQDLRRTLLHILHGLYAIENALTSFVIPYASHESILSVEGHSNILSDFDAHVGDTACHMRAQMIWEVYEYYKPTERRTWIDMAFIALGQVKMRTVSLMIALHKKKGYMRALGFGSVVTYAQIFDRIGWSTFLDIVDRKSSLPMAARHGAESGSSYTTPLCIPSTPVDLNPTPPLHRSDHFGLFHPGAKSTLRRMASTDSTWSSYSSSSIRSVGILSESASRVPITPSSTTSVPNHSSTGSHSHRNVAADCTWDVSDHLRIVQFLTLCRLLSVGKKAKVYAGFPNAVIRARTDPEFIYGETEKEIESFYNSVDQEVEWKRLVTYQDRMKKTFLVKEEEAAQVWLSNLTADWIVKLAKEVRLSNSMQSLLKDTIMVSPRQIVCAASHPSIVPIRAEWLLRGTPILMIIRRFCSQGYHTSFYRVLPNTSAWGARPPIKNVRAVGLGKQSWFSIQPVDADEVGTAAWSTTPHFVVISNSIDGTNGEFYDRVAEEGYGDSSPPWPHDSEDCEEHKEYTLKVLQSNFAQIVMSFFGQHAQYPFEFPSPLGRDERAEDGHKYIAEKMAERRFGKNALEHYRRSVEEVEESGTGERPWLYTLEHAYTELPFILGRQVKDIIEKKVQPVPIGYRWW